MKNETPNRHAKLSTAQLQKQNEEAEAWLAKHKPHLLSSVDDSTPVANRHSHILPEMRAVHAKRVRSRAERISNAKKDILKLCKGQEFVEVRQVAKILGTSRQTLQGWAEKHFFPKYKMVKLVCFYSTADIVDFYKKLDNEKALETANHKGLTSNQRKRKNHE